MPVASRCGSSRTTRWASDSSRPFYAALQAAGISLVDDGDNGRIMHNKYAVIDGDGFDQLVRTTSLPTTTMPSSSLPQTWPASSSTISTRCGPASLGVPRPPPPTTTLTYDGSPLEVYFSPQDNALDQVIAEVDAAQSSIDFAIFFFTDDRLRDALIAADARGVQVRGVFDELGGGNASSDDEALCEAGVPVGFEDTPGKMHHKLMAISS